ncbi:MAG: hypothetical protein JST05_11085 [Acidobacteria bacterium]|nr:hypothetical protein [Acidobacteriota bacterium]
MSETQDAEITRELEAIVAAKDREQIRMKLFLASGLVLLVVAAAFHHHLLLALALALLAIALLTLGVKHHLRASALRGQALEKILAEAFRRAGKDVPKAEP